MTERIASPTVPLPPPELAARTGAVDPCDPIAGYDDLGQQLRRYILDALPADWSLEGKRVLDFGCGAGRVLRAFLQEAQVAEFYGCDIDARSIEWLERHLCPPLHVLRSHESPPLELPGDSFDLVYAISVFTHLTDGWSGWLLELHRLLKDGGYLLATFLGPGMSKLIAGEEWIEGRVGMNVLRHGQSWDLGGPMVSPRLGGSGSAGGRRSRSSSSGRPGSCPRPPAMTTGSSSCASGPGRSPGRIWSASIR